MNADISSQIQETGVIAVLVIDHLESAGPLVEALLAGGVRAVEVTLRTPVALQALRLIRQSFPEILAGAGTVLTREQVGEVKESGAAFGVAPGVNPAVLSAANTANLPFAPGIATPSDIETAIAHGCRLLKFFPAEPLGGLPYLNAISAPYAHLNLRYVPLGGLNEDNMASYLRHPAVAALGGSWLAPRSLIHARDWKAITALCRHVTETIRAVRQSGSGSHS